MLTFGNNWTNNNSINNNLNYQIKPNFSNERITYIKRNNIVYKGTLVSLICGGLMLGTVSLKEVDNNYSNYVIDHNIVLNVFHR